MSWILASVSGLLTGFSFFSERTAFLCFFSVAPAVIAAMKAKKFAPVVMALYGFFLALPSSLWLTELYTLGFTDSYSVVVVAVAGMCVLSGLIFFFAFLPFFHTLKVLPVYIVFPFLMIFAEYIPLSLGILSFPWVRLAAAVSCYTPFIQSASLLGSLFVSLIVAAINVFLALAAVNLRLKRMLTLYLSCAVTLFFVNTVFGAVEMSTHRDGESISVGAVQGNVGGNGKWELSADETLYLYSELTHLLSAKRDTALFVFPETAYPATINDSALSSLKALAASVSGELIVGFFEEEGGKLYNALAAVDNEGNLSLSYRKNKLVPLGEYDPSGIIHAFLPVLEPLIGDLSAGETGGVLDTRSGKIGTVICFETAFPSYSLFNARNGAELNVVASNDSWFGTSHALYQHHAHAILRAVETGRCTVCAVNTGISSVISDRGKVITAAGAGITGAVAADIKKITDKTLYTYVGDILIMPCFFFYLLKIKLLLESVNASARID